MGDAPRSGSARRGSLDPPDREAFRAAAHRALDRALDLQEVGEEEPVWRSAPADVRARLREPVPLRGRGIEGALSAVERDVLPWATGNRHPRFWGWVCGQGTPGGIVAELLAAGMNTSAGPFEDAASLVDDQVLEWMRTVFSFPEGSSGVLTSGGSEANLVGIAVGRDARAPFDVVRHGLARGPRLVVYASSEVHSSVGKAIQVLGLGRDSLRLLPVDAEHRLDPAELERAVAADRAAGHAPAVLVATAGTVNAGAIDDLDALGRIARRERLWLHVDGAFGALAAFSPRLAGRLSGLERADSLAFDFHKWMSVPYDAGCVLVRDAAAHERTFTHGASYLAPLERGPAARARSTDRRGVQLSRGFRALKVWMTLQEHGLERFGRLVERNVEQAQVLAGLVAAAPELALLAPVPLNVVNFRWAPEGVEPARLDELNREILLRLQESGLAVPSATRIDGRFSLRVALTNHRTREEDLALLVEAVRALGPEVLGDAR